MRELKFRAWDKKNKVFIDPFMLEDITKIDNAGGRFNSTELDFMQYTGLKDKNGKEIYEGDIVKGSGLGVVEYDLEHLNCGFVINRSKVAGQERQTDMPLGIPSDKVIEVIGNIYENPELLK